ncbi:MAG: ATP-binding protein [Candidatus Omnitrophota bacterium]|nr:ATP-binding protein [Candidatus Omnitrophota bacterium]
MNDGKKMEQELAQAKKKIQTLESRLAEVEQKTKVVSMAQAFLHEITSTLTYIKAPIEFLNRFYLKELKNIYGTIEQHLSDAERTKFFKNFDSIDKNLKAILTGSEKIRTMTEFSKGTLASEENTYGNVYLSLVLDSAKESGGIPGTGCAFDVDMPDGFIVWGNSILLERVFANLITNSLEAMSGQKDKEITLRCSYRKLNGAKATYFEYSDSGPGIPSHLRETVFRQGVSTKNSGHGLHVCREIIEGFHGGKIDIQDDANKKSKFAFWFPFANADKAIGSDKGNGIHSETEKTLGPNKGNKHAVLIIEDYKDIREILEEKFEEWDLEVSCAKNVEEAQKLRTRGIGCGRD